MELPFLYSLTYSAASLLLKVLAINIAILPVLARLERLNYRMPGFFKMLCCVLIF